MARLRVIGVPRDMVQDFIDKGYDIVQQILVSPSVRGRMDLVITHSDETMLCPDAMAAVGLIFLKVIPPKDTKERRETGVVMLQVAFDSPEAAAAWLTIRQREMLRVEFNARCSTNVQHHQMEMGRTEKSPDIITLYMQVEVPDDPKRTSSFKPQITPRLVDPSSPAFNGTH